MSKTWSRTKAKRAIPAIRWNAQATIPSDPRYRNSMEPPERVPGDASPLDEPPAGVGPLGRRRHRLQPRDDRVGEIAGSGRSAEIVGDRLAFGEDRTDGRLDALGRRLL